MNADRGYLVAVLLGLAAAALVSWQLERSESTECFRASVKTGASARAEALERCESKLFDPLRSPIEVQRGATELEARSALVVWIALFAATAGFAAIVAVQSLGIIGGLRPRWDADLIARSAGAAILVALPFALFRLIPFELSPFDDLHQPQLMWIPPLIGLLMLPALTGLVVIWQILTVRSDLGLRDAASLGSRMRQLVGMLGTVLALSVLTTGARWQAIGTIPGGESVPSIVILLWESIFALVLAALYVPVHQRWTETTTKLISDEVTRQLRDQPLPGTTGFRLAELSLAKELHASLGVGGALKSLQGSVAVLAPVIAAAVSSLFA